MSSKKKSRAASRAVASHPAIDAPAIKTSQDLSAQGKLRTLWEHPAFPAVIVALVAFALYSRSLWFGFVWDDHVQITHNPLIRSWTAWHAIFTHHFGVQQTTDIRYYRPLLNLWSILLFKLLNLRPAGWHLMTVLLHAGASMAVYWMARVCRFKANLAFFAALLFAVHPIHIESACWISGGGDSMLTIFCVLSFIAFRLAPQSSGQARWCWRLSSWLLLLLALWTKETAISFFAVVFTFGWTQGEADKEKSLRSAVMAALPYALVTLAYVVGRKLALEHVVQFPIQVSVQQVLATLPGVVIRDLGLLLWPVGLNALRTTPYVTAIGMQNFLLPVLLLTGIGGLIWWWRRKGGGPDVVFFSFWIILTLLPTLYLPILRAGDFVRDRYLYLPSVGFVLLLAKGLELVPGRRVFAVIATSLIILGIAGSLGQQSQWANDLALFERGYRLNPTSRAGINYAYALLVQREYAHARDVLENEMVPRYGDEGAISTGLAISDGRLGDFARGQSELQNAIDTDLWDVSLGSKTNVAMAMEALNEYPSALAWLQEVLQQSPEYLSAITETGYTYERMGDFAEAEKWYGRSLALDPYDSQTLFNFGHALIASGAAIEGEKNIRLAVKFGPVARGYHEELARSLVARGERVQAVEELKQELQVSPGNSTARQLLASMLSKQ